MRPTRQRHNPPSGADGHSRFQVSGFGFNPTRESAIELLRARGVDREAVFRRADALRRERMGDAVHIRGIIEFSNQCANDCLYCGLRRSRADIRRYRMTPEAILETVRALPPHFGTVVLQAGETPGPWDDTLAGIIRAVKADGRAVTISAGNRPLETYRAWREAGMDRYLLRFETADPERFRLLHPDCTLEERLACLERLRSLGVQLGSGFMVGLPGDTVGHVADNILLCRALKLDMIGIGPFIPNPDTPLGSTRNAFEEDPEMALLALAVLRLFNPDAHIPATTAYDALLPGSGRNRALRCGANVFMPNSTPVRHRADYLLYPGKPCVDESGEACAACVIQRLHSLGRPVGEGPGHAVGFADRDPPGHASGP